MMKNYSEEKNKQGICDSENVWEGETNFCLEKAWNSYLDMCNEALPIPKRELQVQ